ncbi:hypothetical protein KBY80_12560 [Synechococcus sp. JJ3a-Johnson]|uniref:hypothetical protein n=1 Tax=unclassified Synechococcus TaxID=2626047 RepID=UPI0020CC6947|nr:MULTISPECIES: hypothetical protein [unclassified Synechococcus]MCP9832204.1 hypothetical protein [Synechococcus sp. JJ3a-Johnson]
MATCTQPIGQSLFDFLDGKNAFEKIEAIQSGELGREINSFVQAQLDRLHVGFNQDFPWASHGGQETGIPGLSQDAIVFGARNSQSARFDLVNSEGTRISGPDDLQPGLGGLDDALTGQTNPTEQIFKSHRC